MSKRLELHEILCSILGCDTSGSGCRCYFQPPASLTMQYPAIRYSLDKIENLFANNGVYASGKKYSVILICSDPDNEYVDKIAALPTSRFDRYYASDNLNHYVFEIYSQSTSEGIISAEGLEY